jgi:hypothetical protein
MKTPADETLTARGALKLSSALLIGGFLFNAIVTMAAHPSGAEDDHESIFREYADSGPWIIVHIGQFVGVLVALAGLLLLYRVVRRTSPYLSLFAAGATIATAAAWAMLQGLDGVALKQAVDAWVESSGAEQTSRFADAETIRWLEWGFQSYFRMLMGLSFVLFGGALAVGRLVPAWLGWLAILAGALSIAIGIDVGYSGLEGTFQDAVSIVFQLVSLGFVVGLFLVARGRNNRLDASDA